jgi:two-component sensor histidine kinase
MAVISSLLALQEYASEDASAKKMLEESQRRIKSMALVHEKLYRSNDLTSIDFGDYITTIVTEVSSAYLKGPRSIRTEIDAESLFLDIDLAIPCGLVSTNCSQTPSNTPSKAGTKAISACISRKRRRLSS